LIYYPIQLALNIKSILKKNIIFCSDSDQYIKYVQKNFKIKTLKRSKKLSNDRAKIYNVILFVLNFQKKNKILYKNILLLEPTSPLTQIKHINKALQILESKKNKIDSVCPIVKLDKFNPFFSINLKNNFFNNDIMPNSLNRQLVKNTYFLSGNFYLSKVSSFIKNKGFYSKKTYALKIEKKFYTDIDDLEDFQIASIKKKIYKI